MKKLFEISAGIVTAKASLFPMSAQEIEEALVKVFSTLQQIRVAEEKKIPLQLQASINPIFQERTEKVSFRNMSMDDGAFLSLDFIFTLKKLSATHLAVHGVTPEEYEAFRNRTTQSEDLSFPCRQSRSASR